MRDPKEIDMDKIKPPLQPKAGLRPCLLTTRDGGDSQIAFFTDATISSFGLGRFIVVEKDGVTHITPSPYSVIGSSAMVEYAIKIVRDALAAAHVDENEVGSLLTGALVAEQKVKELEQALIEREAHIEKQVDLILQLQGIVEKNGIQIASQAEAISRLHTDLAETKSQRARAATPLTLLQLASFVAGRPLGGVTERQVETARIVLGENWGYDLREKTLMLEGGHRVELISDPHDLVVIRYACTHNRKDVYLVPPAA